MRRLVRRSLRESPASNASTPGVTPPSIDLGMIPNTLAPLLELAFNDPSIFRVIEQITRCPPIARFGGFVYRLSPLHGHRHH